MTSVWVYDTAANGIGKLASASITAGPMAGYQPQQGELVGVFVAAGNLRNVTDGSQSPLKERSNVVIVPFGQ